MTDLCTFVSHQKGDLARQLLDTEVGAQVLGAATAGICQVLRVNAKTMGCIANPVPL